MANVLSVPTLSKAEQLIAQSEMLSREDFEGALALAQEAMRVAENEGDYRCFAEALAQEAAVNSRLNNHEAAMLGAYEALHLSRTYGFTRAEARAVWVIAFIFRICGLQEESMQLFRHSMNLWEKVNDAHHFGLAINSYTMSRYDLGEKAGVIEALEYALTIIPPEASRGADHALLLTNIATILGWWGRPSEAIPYAEHSLVLSQLAGCNRQTLATLHVMVNIYLIAGNIEAALKVMEAARTLRTRELDLNHVNGEMIEARILAAQNRNDEALEKWESAYNLAIQGQMLHFAIHILDSIRLFHEQNGELQRVIETYRRLNEDIVQRQRQHANLRLTVLALAFAQDKATLTQQIEITQQKYTLLHRISHEFRTPLTVIQSSAEMMETYGEKMPLDRRQKHLKNITGQVRSMTAMLENITALLEEPDTAHLHSGTSSALNTLAYRVIAQLESVGVATERVHIAIPSDALNVTVPENSVIAVAYHLLHNALRYSTGEVEFELFVYGGGLMLRVVDSGIGIPESELESVFEPLVRGSNQTEPTGGGLGLAIVAKQVAQMRGTVDVVSTVNHGTTVTVRLPL